MSKASDRLLRQMRDRGAVPVSDATLAAVQEAPAARLSDSLTLPLSAIEPSPFQPEDRPSAGALARVAEAIATAGLAGLRDGTALVGMDAEARELADLVADIGAPDDPDARGIEAPLEARPKGAGRYELLSGHRRFAAARLAGHRSVPVAVREDVASDVQAAEIVFRRNRLRADFTPYQEATAMVGLIQRRQAAGQDVSARSLGRALGYSHTKANELRQIGEALAPDKLGPLTSEVRALSYRRLRDLAQLDPASRIALLGKTSVPSADNDTSDGKATVEPFAIRAGKLTLRHPAERLTREQAQDALDQLAPLVSALRRRAKRD